MIYEEKNIIYTFISHKMLMENIIINSIYYLINFILCTNFYPFYQMSTYVTIIIHDRLLYDYVFLMNFKFKFYHISFYLYYCGGCKLIIAI